MMVKVFALLALLAWHTAAFATGNTPASAPAAVRDDWAGAPAHFAVSGAFGVACATHVFPRESLKAFGCALVPGVVKEIIDSKQRGNHFSQRDMLANAAGAALGVYLGGVMLRRHEGTTQVAVAAQF